VVGYYLSFSYLALAIGTVVAGWLSDKFQRRKMPIVVCGMVSLPAFWLMGRATNVWHLAALTAAVWFSGGVGLTLLSILTGLFAEKAQRGKVFGFLSLTGTLGASIGGLTTGAIADRWGYPTMFAALSLFSGLLPLAALLLKDKRVARVQDGGASISRHKTGLGGSFFLLLLASLTVGVAQFVANLGRSLAMGDLGFGATAISSTAAVGALIALPFPVLVGWLSDRIGRKRLLVAGYLACTAGLLVLAVSASLWHFWLVLCLMSVLYSVGSVGSALATDVTPPESLGRGISLLGATTWVGGIIGFAGTGHAIQSLGMTVTFRVGALLPLMAIALLIPIRQAGREKRAAPSLGKSTPVESLNVTA
jgi:MFS family permease